ncbi:MAG: prolyl oligopeptidase family serine peptidase [Porticoccaceae bacterium]
MHFTDQLSCPVIFFQGLEDKVVPPEQAVSMVQSLRSKKLAVAYLPFPGEGHGFRRAETICRTFNAELYFYSKVFGFSIGDAPAPVTIDNLDAIQQHNPPRPCEK